VVEQEIMNDNELKKILADHVLWLSGDSARTKANLREADLSGADLREADLSGADLCRADLRGADLRGADLRGADLRGADLREADLRRADLRRADLRGADLRGADLCRADLREADLRGAIGYISGPQRTDGYQFAAVYMGNIFAWKVVAGCRHMCIENYRKHIESYNDPAKAAETAAILDFLEARTKQVGDPK
jgi:hypothetical protein